VTDRIFRECARNAASPSAEAAFVLVRCHELEAADGAGIGAESRHIHKFESSRFTWTQAQAQGQASEGPGLTPLVDSNKQTTRSPGVISFFQVCVSRLSSHSEMSGLNMSHPPARGPSF